MNFESIRKQIGARYKGSNLWTSPEVTSFTPQTILYLRQGGKQNNIARIVCEDISMSDECYIEVAPFSSEGKRWTELDEDFWKTLSDQIESYAAANNGVSIGYRVTQRSIPIEQEELRKRLALNIPVGSIINEELIDKVTQVVQDYVQEVESAPQKETL